MRPCRFAVARSRNAAVQRGDLLFEL